jgi:uncharacterized membrane protein
MSGETTPANHDPETDPSHFGNEVHRIVVHQQEVRHSTIFDPAVLERYSRMVPDAPERILKVFEQNSELEREMAREALKAARDDNQRRDWMGFVIIMGGMATSAVLAYLDKPWLSGGALVAIIAYAVIGFLGKKGVPPPPAK